MCRWYSIIVMMKSYIAILAFTPSLSHVGKCFTDDPLTKMLSLRCVVHNFKSNLPADEFQHLTIMSAFATPSEK